MIRILYVCIYWQCIEISKSNLGDIFEHSFNFRWGILLNLRLKKYYSQCSFLLLQVYNTVFSSRLTHLSVFVQEVVQNTNRISRIAWWVCHFIKVAKEERTSAISIILLNRLTYSFLLNIFHWIISETKMMHVKCTNHACIFNIFLVILRSQLNTANRYHKNHKKKLN